MVGDEERVTDDGIVAGDVRHVGEKRQCVQMMMTLKEESLRATTEGWTSCRGRPRRPKGTERYNQSRIVGLDNDGDTGKMP